MPDNSGFYYAAYGIALFIYAAYAWSISSRVAALRRRRRGGGVSPSRET